MRVHTFQEGDFPQLVNQTMPVHGSNAANRLFLKAVVFTADAAGISNRRNDQPAAAERADALRFTCDHNIRDCSDTFLMLLVGHLRIHTESSSSPHSGECSRQLPSLAPERPASDRGAHHPSIPVHTTPQYSWRGTHRSMNSSWLSFL